MAGGRGGKRPGAGRPKGSQDVLPRGSVKAIRALVVARKRMGEDADKEPEALAVVERCYERVLDVLEERVDSFHAPGVLRAAAALADGVCGRQAEKVQVDQRLTLGVLVMRSMEVGKTVEVLDAHPKPLLPS